MSIGNPTIIAVTPHGPPNSQLRAVNNFRERERKIEPRKNLPGMGVEELICLAAFIGDDDLH
jgi:hypothetical protein